MKEELEFASGMTFMHVCGTHQDTIVRSGLLGVARRYNVDLREGPGCPVCVTPNEEIEAVLELGRKGKIIATFGDMYRVPGPSGSLEDLRAMGADVRVVYSIYDALNMAKGAKEDVVFFAVGFETTAPATAHVLLSDPPENFFIFSSHRRTPPAVEGVLSSGEVRLDGVILPGHVSAIIGEEGWLGVAEKFDIPMVITGFEPEDVLASIALMAKMRKKGIAGLRNEYRRVVRREGLPEAKRALEEAFEFADAHWRGFERLPDSLMLPKPRFQDHDARKAFEDIVDPILDQEFPEPPGCRCPEVIRAEAQPWECPLFGTACTPEHPVGPCMVSSEGACSIVYKYGRDLVML